MKKYFKFSAILVCFVFVLILAGCKARIRNTYGRTQYEPGKHYFRRYFTGVLDIDDFPNNFNMPLSPEDVKQLASPVFYYYPRYYEVHKDCKGRVCYWNERTAVKVLSCTYYEYFDDGRVYKETQEYENPKEQGKQYVRKTTVYSIYGTKEHELVEDIDELYVPVKP